MYLWVGWLEIPILLKYYMNLEDWQNLHDRLDSAHRNIIGIRAGHQDLRRMHRTVSGKLTEADKEWVNCRRRGIGSSKFDRLLNEAEEALKNFEGYIMFAKLMHKEQKWTQPPLNPLR